MESGMFDTESFSLFSVANITSLSREMQIFVPVIINNF